MKKIFATIIVLALCLSCVSAFALAETPVIKLSDFYYGTEDLAEGTAPSASDPLNLSAGTYGQAGDSFTYEGSTCVWTAGTGWLQMDVAGPGWCDIRNYKYIAFKVENTESNPVNFCFIPSLVHAGGSPSGEALPHKLSLINTDGSAATDCTMVFADFVGAGSDRCYINIPAGKTVWVVCPVSSTNIPNFTNMDAQNGNFEIKNPDDWAGGTTENAVHIWKFDFTANSVENPTDSADLSVISYAAVALCGASALVITGKKRS